MMILIMQIFPTNSTMTMKFKQKLNDLKTNSLAFYRKNLILKLSGAALLGATLLACTSQKKIMKQETPKDWMHSGNIYEVNVRQYTKEGTFRAFEEHLPRLRKMGVQTLWFMPVTPIAQQNKKGTMGSPYAAQDYTAINPEFGTLEDFKHLVKEAHNQGFKVIIDWVANHTGWDHIWTKTHPEYYLKENGTFKIASGMDDIIELDYGNPELRKAMIDAMKFWVRETDIDGFRCDLASWVEVDFWEEARPEVETLKPLFFLGEFDELENPEYGKVFDASYSWSWMHKTRDYYHNNLPLNELREMLMRYGAIGDDSMRAWFTTNHDENTWNGTEYEKYGDIALPLAVFSATWNGIPLMYSGQELPNHKRLEFFEKDPISWTGDFQLAKFYKKLFELREKNPALRGGDSSVQTSFVKTSADDKILAYLRKNGADEVLVVLNMSKDFVPFEILDDHINGEFKNHFTGFRRNFSDNKSFTMQKGDFAVFVKK